MSPAARSILRSNPRLASPQGRNRAAAVSAVGAGLLALSCGLDHGFEELGDELISPDVGYIETPGRRIASGRYRRFSVRAPTLEDRYIAAFKGSNLVLLRFEEDGEECEIGEARSFGTSISGEGAFGLNGREALLPYLVTRDADGRGELRFSSYSCETNELSVADVPLPREALEADDHFHLLVRNGSGELLAIEPWEQEVTTLGADVAYFEVKGENLWSVEQGQLVLRDARLRELGRAGSAINEFALARGSAGDWAAYLESGSLYLVEASDSFATPTLVAEDVCGVAHVGNSRERVLRYYSPCATRHLVLHDVIADERHEYVDQVVTTGIVVRAGGSFDLNYWTGSESNRGTLWIALAGQEPIRVFDDALVQPGALYRDWATAIVGWTGRSGELVSWRNGMARTIASGVAEMNSLGVIANFQDGVGDLLQVLIDDTTRELGSGVPLDATRGRAFLANTENSRGDLFVLESHGVPRKVASDVAPSAFLFSVQIETLLMMLSDFDDATDTATLQVRLLDTGDQFEVSSQVSELVEVGFPRPGVLYSVANGDRQGLWFAGVR